jgi:hypothetical protein
MRFNKKKTFKIKKNNFFYSNQKIFYYLYTFIYLKKLKYLNYSIYKLINSNLKTIRFHLFIF